VRLSQVKKTNNYNDSDNTKTELKAKKSYIDTPKKTDAFDNNYVAKKEESKTALEDERKSEETTVIKEVINIEDAKENINDNIEIRDIQAKWREFILKIKSENHSLTFILQNCWPSTVKDGIIELKCKYKFHQERLKDANIKDIVNKNLKEIFKTKLQYITNIDSNLEIPSSKDIKNETNIKVKNEVKKDESDDKKHKRQVDDNQKGAINNILNAFGGEVIS
jgi:hypothetical protein